MCGYQSLFSTSICDYLIDFQYKTVAIISFINKSLVLFHLIRWKIEVKRRLALDKKEADKRST